jgi:dihydrofolate reductase
VREVVPEDIQRLKQQPSGDMVVGGANLAATFARYGLIDEYRIYLQPVVLGAGHPLFPPSRRGYRSGSSTRTASAMASSC